MELWRLRYLNLWNLFEDKILQHAIYSSCWDFLELLGLRARLDRFVARFLRWNKVSFDKYSLWFSINFTMEGSLNVDNFDKSLFTFAISFSMEGSLLRNRS